MSRAFEEALKTLQEYEASGILLDTNLLVIYYVALIDIRRVGRVKRTENFQPEDASFLLHLVSRYAKRHTTPGILAEATNLLEPFFKSLSGDLRQWLQAALREDLAVVEEHFVPAKTLAQDDQLLTYGFSDLAIAHIQQDRMLVLTADLPLTLLLQRRGIACVNYNTFRLLVL